MKILLKLKMTSVILLAFILGASKLHAQTLVLWHADKSTTEVELYTQTKVNFKDGKMYITSSVLNMEYDAADVLRFTYKGKSLGIKNVRKEADYSMKNGKIVFHGVKKYDKIGVYMLNGIKVPVNLDRGDNEATLPVSALQSGAYLVKINSKTFKFVKP